MARRTTLEVDASLRAKFADGQVKSGFCAHIAVEKSEVNFDVTPYGSTHHHAATGGRVRHKPRLGFIPGFVGLGYVIALISTGGGSVEEVADLHGNGRKVSVVGQLVSNAQICIGSHGHSNDFGFEVNKCECAALVRIGLTEIDMPFQ